MARRTWEELDALAGRKISRTRPALETENEVWMSCGNQLVIWQNGALADDHLGSSSSATRPFVSRRTLYDVIENRVVDLELREDHLVLRRGSLNGSLCETWEPTDAVEHIVRHYLELGFVEADPWGFPPFGHMERETLSRASHRNEADLQAALAGGDALRMMELLNPDTSRSTLDAAPSKDPYAAVDAAVARIRELARRFPKGHFLVETLDLECPAHLQVLEDHGYDAFFIEQHRENFNRWAKLGAPAASGSSWRYFLEKYGSLTWIVASAVAKGLPTFYCGNVSGGGWSCLQLGEDLADASDLEDEEPGHGFTEAQVFHGGWGRTGYLFDRRVVSPSGEFGIYEFTLDGPISEYDIPPTADELPSPDAITPFGFWLERHVNQLVGTLSARVSKVQRPVD